MSQYKQVTVKVTPEEYGKEVTFVAERPYREDLDGYVAFFGGGTNLYNKVDTTVERAASQNGKVKFNKPPTGGWNDTNLAETIGRAKDAIRGYAPDAGGGSGVQVRARNVDAFQAAADADSAKFAKVDPLDLISRMSGRMSPSDFSTKYGFDVAA